MTSPRLLRTIATTSGIIHAESMKNESLGAVGDKPSIPLRLCFFHRHMVNIPEGTMSPKDFWETPGPR